MPNSRVESYTTATAGGLARALARREIGALELVDEAIRTIEARDGPINAVVVRDFERARALARAADAALARGERRPLLGVPLTVKESHNVAGLPTTWGVEAFRGFVPGSDALGVARLKAAGAIILGKSNVPTWLADYQSANPIYGRTCNPHDPARGPGGSSGGGAAALAAGMVPLEFGSDLGGSIRVPAHLCGVFGHKPSYGLIPTDGHVPPGIEKGAPLALAVLGPLARSADDLALALGVLAGPDPREAVGWKLDLPPPRHARLADYRVLVLDSHPAAPLDGELREALQRLAERIGKAGARVSHDAARLLPDLARQHEVFGTMLATQLSRGAPPQGAPVTAHAWMDTLDAQAVLCREWARLFEEWDVVLAPPFGTAAFAHIDAPDEATTLPVDGRPAPYAAQGAWSGMALVANLPATVAPIGRTMAGLPIGVQIIGPYLEDRTTIAFAGLLERELAG